MIPPASGRLCPPGGQYHGGDRWTPPRGHRRVDTAAWTPPRGHRRVDTAAWTPPRGHRRVDTAAWTPPRGHRRVDTAAWTPPGGHRRFGSLCCGFFTVWLVPLSRGRTTLWFTERGPTS